MSNATLKTEKRTLGGLDVQSTEFPVMTQCDLFARIEPFINAMDLEDASSILKAMTVLMGNRKLVMDLIANTAVVIQRDGKSVQVYLSDETTINAALPGKLDTLIDIVIMAFQVNFADFFDRLASRAPSQPVAVGAPSL